MTTKYKDYTIDIIDDPSYTLNSAYNIFTYDKSYFDESESQPASKHGIRICKSGQEVTSAIICETGGATGIHDTSFLIKDDNLFICCCNTVYSFRLPDLTLNWRKELDQATCFGIYPFRDEFIIHGELEIKRIDVDGNVKWSFSANDIFVGPDGTGTIKVTQDKIEITDWDGDKFILDELGQLIK